jgi:hypothetical protein
MNHLYTFLALDIAAERSQEAFRHRRAAMLAASHPERPSLLRRGLARGLAAVSRLMAGAVRRLDDCVADDLARSLAPSK